MQIYISQVIMHTPPPEGRELDGMRRSLTDTPKTVLHGLGHMHSRRSTKG